MIVTELEACLRIRVLGALQAVGQGGLISLLTVGAGQEAVVVVPVLEASGDGARALQREMAVRGDAPRRPTAVVLGRVLGQRPLAEVVVEVEDARQRRVEG